MLGIVRTLLWFLVSLLKLRRRLEAENLALRHQVNVLGRSAPRPPRFGSADRILLVWLYRLWPGVLSSIVIVRPDPGCVGGRQSQGCGAD